MKKITKILIPTTLISSVFPLTANAEESSISLKEVFVNDNESVIEISNPNNLDIRFPNGNYLSTETIYYTVNRNGTYDFIVNDDSGAQTVESISVNKLRTNLLITNDRNVKLRLNAEDTLSGMSQMKFKNEKDGAWTSYEDYKTSKDWVLDSKEGIKSVYVMYKDIAGNETTEIYDQICLDITGPNITAFTINNGAKYTNNRQVTLRITALDNYSNVSYYLISNDGTNWTKTEPSNSINWTLTQGTGNKTIYVKAVDSLGNVGAVTTQNIYFDEILPTGSISINNGANLTNSRNVKLQLNFKDAESGVKRVSIIEGDKSYTFPTVPSSPTEIDWTLSLGSKGQVALEVEDNAGNIYKTLSNEITISTLEVSQFRLINVVNPLVYNDNNPFIPLVWDFSSQSMVAGGNISFDINYKLDLDDRTSAVVNGDYVIEIIGDNYHKTIINNYNNSINKGFEATVTLPNDAPVGSKVYLYSTLSATLTNSTEVFTNTARFPGANEKALIGTIDGNIKESIKFNEIR